MDQLGHFIQPNLLRLLPENEEQRVDGIRLTGPVRANDDSNPVGEFKSDSRLAGATNDETLGLAGFFCGDVAAEGEEVAGAPNKFCN